MTAKSRVLLKGVELVVTLGIKNLHIEGDSMTMIDLVNHGHFHSWNIRDILLDIKLLTAKLERKHLSHIFCGGNQVEDNMANLGSSWSLCKFWKRLECLPVNI